jgi:hypothetical protein
VIQEIDLKNLRSRGNAPGFFAEPDGKDVSYNNAT